MSARCNCCKRVSYPIEAKHLRIPTCNLQKAGRIVHIAGTNDEKTGTCPLTFLRLNDRQEADVGIVPFSESWRFGPWNKSAISYAINSNLIR